jgi:hypothetical protein
MQPTYFFCIVCQLQQTNGDALSASKSLKGIILYKENGIFALNKHFAFHHLKGVKKWGAYAEQQENNFEDKYQQKCKVKKKISSQFFLFFVNKVPYSKIKSLEEN